MGYGIDPTIFPLCVCLGIRYTYTWSVLKQVDSHVNQIICSESEIFCLGIENENDNILQSLANKHNLMVLCLLIANILRP